MRKNKTLDDHISKNGNRLTNSRRAILKVLKENKTLLSAEDIYLKVRRQNTNVGLTTVYRALELFTNLGLTKKIDFSERKTKYELRSGKDENFPNQHLVCISCKKIISVEDVSKLPFNNFKKIGTELEKQFNFKVFNSVVQFQGLCSKCKKNNF